MSRPQDANGGDSLQIWGGSCEYIEKAVADSRHGVILKLGGWAWALKISLLRNNTKDLVFERILWINNIL
jgi:hypothetical protein